MKKSKNLFTICRENIDAPNKDEKTGEKPHHSLWHDRWEYAHHLIMAAVIASATLFLDVSGYLNWLDTVSLRLANTLNQHQLIEQSSTPDAPVTLLITDALYENIFDQSSPLDRGKLASLIEPVLAQNPALLVVDIDFSPGANDRDGNSIGQVKLNNLLDTAAKGGCKPQQKQGEHSGCKIVLAMPLPVTSPPLQKLQFDWMKARCIAGVQFAMTNVSQHQGILLRYSTSAPLLGNVAAWWLASNKEHIPKQTEHHEVGHNNEHEKNHSAICSLLGQSKDSDDFSTQIKLNPLAQENDKIVPLNTDYFGIPNSLVSLDKSAPDYIKQNESVRNRVVFLGGNYGKDDNFITARGERAGVTIHAATFYSAIHGIEAPSHVKAWLVDIAIGLLMGILFQQLWIKYNEASEKIQCTNTPCGKFKAFCRAKFWLMLNLALLLLLIVSFLGGAGWLLSKGLWLNPGPMMIGMFIDTLLSSRLKGGHHLMKGRDLLKVHPDIFWQVPFVIFTLVYMLFFGHH